MGKVGGGGHILKSLQKLFFSVHLILFFSFSLTAFLRLFHSYRDKPIGRLGETGVPRKKTHLTHPQAELGLSHMWPVGASNLQATPVTAVSNLNSLLVKRQIDNPSPDQLVCHHNFKVKEKSREESSSFLPGSVITLTGKR